MEETAYAKINLALHIRGREPDGYHRIETIFAFAEDGDRLNIQDADQLMLILRGPFAETLGASGDNLVIRAAEAFREHYGIRFGAAIMLDKRLPVASGIGGGSADAAAALRLLARWWGVETVESDLLDIARSLGADVPACIRSETARGEGRGDILVSQDGSGLAGMPLLLVNPLIPVSTAAVFSAWDGVDRGALPIGVPLAVAMDARNDLEAPACSIATEIGEILAALRQAPGAALVRMSGSGATCFGLFASALERDAAADAIASLRPDWWQLRSRLR